MQLTRPDQSCSLTPLPLMPAWIITARDEALEDVSFLSGAALSHLHLVLEREDVPHALLRDRLALRSAEACVEFSGRPERAGNLRDALLLLRPGDLPGPAGQTFLNWRRAVKRPVSVKALARALPPHAPDQIAAWLEVGRGAPVARAATVLETVLREAPRADVAALILAEAALAQALGWGHITPLLSAGLKRADLGTRGACHRALISSTIETVRQAADLVRRSANLKSVAPKLRAKQAGGAVEMFLTRDAVAPSSLPLPDRAARRLCDRLVDLGAIRELTGRDTFRLYGV